MSKEQVLKKIIEAIGLIENNLDKHFTDYTIIDALYEARDYLMLGESEEENRMSAQRRM